MSMRPVRSPPWLARTPALTRPFPARLSGGTLIQGSGDDADHAQSGLVTVTSMDRSPPLESKD
jgi:hypothetical protein